MKRPGTGLPSFSFKNVKNSFFNDFIKKVYTSGYLHALLLLNLFIIYNNFFLLFLKKWNKQI